MGSGRPPRTASSSQFLIKGFGVGVGEYNQVQGVVLSVQNRERVLKMVSSDLKYSISFSL